MFSKKAISAIFLSILLLPFILSSLNIPALFSSGKTNTENRNLAKKPEININVLDGYPTQYSDYYNDQFPFRNILLQAYTDIKIRCFDESPVPDKVIIGKDYWLFYKLGELGLYDGSKKLSDSSLHVYLNELLRRKKYLDQRNCSMYLYIIPAKMVVYPEYFRKDIQRYSEQTEGQQLAEYIKKNSDVHITYLLSALQQAKSPDSPILYYKTDTHWNDYGAFIGCRAIIKQISGDFPNLKPLSEKDMTEKDTEYNTGNLSVMMRVQDYYAEKKPMVYPKKRLAVVAPNQNYPPPDNYLYPWLFQRGTPDTTLPSALVIGDSFMAASMGFLAESFNHTAFIWDEWQYKLNENIVDRLKPNVVIYIMWEPELENVIYKRK
jgi:hypothetical protein